MSEDHGGVRLLSIEEQKLGISTERQVVLAEAQSRLRESGYHELHFVSCDFHEGVLTLRGRVSSFHLKQVAQEMIRRLDSAEEINNRLEVAAPPCSP
ncbi:MAG: BON domain-containing protein [Thermoguttaceae bacterium]|jgi:osmotically-inducible protein OsmY